MSSSNFSRRPDSPNLLALCIMKKAVSVLIDTPPFPLESEKVANQHVLNCKCIFISLRLRDTQDGSLRHSGCGIYAASLAEICVAVYVFLPSILSFRRNQLPVCVRPRSVLLFVRTLLILGLKSLPDDSSLCTPHLANTRSGGSDG